MHSIILAQIGNIAHKIVIAQYNIHDNAFRDISTNEQSNDAAHAHIEHTMFLSQCDNL